VSAKVFFVVVGILMWLPVEIDRYIGLPIFFLIFKHFTIIGYRFCKKKKIIIADDAFYK